jgi:hypothetical protein
MKHRREFTSEYAHFEYTVGDAFGGGIYVTGIAPTIQNTLLAEISSKLFCQSCIHPPKAIEITKSDGKGTFNSVGYNLVETSDGMEGMVATDKLDVPALIELPSK